MMRVTFQVRGANQEELDAKAREVLLGFTSRGQEVDFSIEATPFVETYQDEGPISWTGNVTANITDPDGRAQ